MRNIRAQRIDLGSEQVDRLSNIKQGGNRQLRVRRREHFLQWVTENGKFSRLELNQALKEI